MQNALSPFIEQKGLLQAINEAELASVDGGGLWQDIKEAAKEHFWCGVAGIAMSAGTANPAIGLSVYAACQGTTKVS